MSKINPLIKPSDKFSDEQLAGGAGALAAKQDDVQLLRRVVLANLHKGHLSPFCKTNTHNHQPEEGDRLPNQERYP